MLYFSETAWTLPDIMEVNSTFDRDYDQKKYEQKIRELSRNFCVDASKNNQDGAVAAGTALVVLYFLAGR
jgi:hypothetical protein